MAEFSLQSREGMLAAGEGVFDDQAEWSRKRWSSSCQTDPCPEKYYWEAQCCRCPFCSCFYYIVLLYGCLKKSNVRVANPAKPKEKWRDLTSLRCLLVWFKSGIFTSSYLLHRSEQLFPFVYVLWVLFELMCFVFLISLFLFICLFILLPSGETHEQHRYKCSNKTKRAFAPEVEHLWRNQQNPQRTSCGASVPGGENCCVWNLADDRRLCCLVCWKGILSLKSFSSFPQPCSRPCQPINVG